MNPEEVYSSLKDDNEKALDSLRRDLSKLRTGRANLAILDGIKVNYYGQMSSLNQVATLSIPEPRQILIQPWDASAGAEIEKAIRNSDLGLNPLNQGKVIRIILPELTEDRRKELAKMVKKRNEESKVSIRHHRKEALDMLKEMEKDKEITEDEHHVAIKKVQDIVDEYIKHSDEIEKGKEKEILEI